MRITTRVAGRVARRLVPLAGRRTVTAILAGSQRLGVSGRAGTVLVQEAERRLRAGQPERSQEILEALTQRPPTAPGVARGLAQAFHVIGQNEEKAGRWEAAALAYERAIALDDRRHSWRGRLAKVAAKAPSWTISRMGSDAAGVVAPPAKSAVTGWVPAGGDGRIIFRLNGTEIADTVASREVLLGGRRFLEFRRRLQDLWSYAGAGDELSAEHAGRPLPIIGSGERYAFAGEHSRADELLGMLSDGYLFNKYGRLRQSIRLDDAWQRMMFDLFFRLRKDLDEFGVQLFPFYGTLLGAVREHDFIGHDNDFDTVYISRQATPMAVRDEFRAMCAFLLDRGYSLRVKTTHVWVKAPEAGREYAETYAHKIDIFFSWFDEDGHFQTSYGHHGEELQKASEFFELRTERLGTREVPVPVNSEQILTQLYGPGWRHPDPGFSHFSPTRVMHREFLLRLGEANEAHWRQFYRDHQIEGGSSFARFVADRLPPGSRVLDIGCGTGRDSIYLAARGHTVAGADLSTEAVEQAQGAARRAGVDRTRFERLDASSRPDLDRLITGLSAVTQPVVYLRFVLHSVDESTEDALLAGLVDALPGGFLLAAEFRTTRDGKLPKVYGDHYRRYVDEQAFASKLRHRWGFEIEHLEAGRGLSPYQGEDPHLARIIARLIGRRT